METIKQHHQNCIKILEAIDYFKNRIKDQNELCATWSAASFLSIRAQAHHRIEIFNKCIERLEERYNKQLTNIITI